MYGFFIYTPQFQRVIMQPWSRRADRSGNAGDGLREFRIPEKKTVERPFRGVRQMRHPAAVTFQKNKF